MSGPGRPYKDIRGQRFGDLEVTQDPPLRVNLNTLYKVKCVVCGNEKTAYRQHLVSGKVHCARCWSLAGRGIDPVLAAAAEAK
jgi:hypothetical protein